MREAPDLNWKRTEIFGYDTSALIVLVVFGSLCGRMAGQCLKLAVTSTFDMAL
jgi:hypothetical protein